MGAPSPAPGGSAAIVDIGGIGDKLSGINDTLYAALSPVMDGIQRQPVVALMVAAGAYLLLLALVLVAFIRMAKLTRRQALMLQGADGQSIEKMLLDHAGDAQQVRAQIERAEGVGRSNADALRACLKRVGLVRYNAFVDVGGEQSFSVALLDDEGNGLVISGLHSRSDMRVYAKPLVGGASPLSLSEEERQAVDRARSGVGVTDGAAGDAGLGGPRAARRPRGVAKGGLPA